MAQRSLSIGGKTYSIGKSAPKPNPKAIAYSKPTTKPKQVTTVNTSVSTQNTGKVNPRSPSTNNPQVKTQNDTKPRPQAPPQPSPSQVRLQEAIKRSQQAHPEAWAKATGKTPSVTVIKDLQPIQLQTGENISIQNVRYVENPNNQNPQVIDNPNSTPSETFTIPITKGQLTRSAQQEFALHLTGEKPIDPQRLQAIQEGRIIVTEGIKTTFTPTGQQLSVLQAMEKQKQAEKDQARANSEWQKQQDRLQAKIQQMEAERQKTEDFRNRTDEEILQNFIRVQTQKELAGQFANPEVPTNLNQYLAERGFDVTRPETIPTSVLYSTKLDTAEKMLEAGLAPRIINLRLESMGKPLMTIDNPNDTVTNKMTDTQVRPIQNVNWTGIRETPSLPVQLAERHTASTILYTPPNATNINQPIGRSTPLPPNQITRTGLSQPRGTKLSREVESTADTPSWDKIGNMADFSSLALIGASVLKVL